MSEKSALSKTQRYLVLGLFLVVAYFPVFWWIDVEPLQIWDESLFALRAYRVAEYGEYLDNFNRYEGLSDHRNTKPPLMTFVQAGFMKVFGYNELALRLPVALLVLFTALLFIKFARDELDSELTGYFMALTLISCYGFIRTHVGRTCEHDAPLAFFTTASLLYYYKYLERFQKKDLWIAALALTAGVLTKSVVALFILPGMLLYALYKKQLFKLLKLPIMYAAVGVILLALIGPYIYLEWCYPGYIQRAWEYELAGRYSNVIDRHEHGFLWYGTELLNVHFVPWFGILPLAILVLVFDRSAIIKRVTILTAITALCFLLIISLSGTKTFWYAVPVIPLLSILIGMFLFKVFRMLQAGIAVPGRVVHLALLSVFIVCCFAGGYTDVLYKISKHEGHYEELNYGLYIRRLPELYPEAKNFTVLSAEFNPSITFYKEVLNDHRGYGIQQSFYDVSLQSGEQVMICRPYIIDRLADKYEFKELHSFNSCKLLEVVQVKEVVTSGNQP